MEVEDVRRSPLQARPERLRLGAVLGRHPHPQDYSSPCVPVRAPSRWFGHDPTHLPEFRNRNRQELQEPCQREILRELSARATRGTVTLVYGARDDRHNNALVLKEIIEEMVS